MKRSKSKLLKISLIVLVVLIILVGGYFGYKYYYKYRFNKNLDIFQQGITYGYTQALLQIINISDKCEPFPVYVGNETRELVSVTCYR